MGIDWESLARMLQLDWFNPLSGDDWKEFGANAADAIFNTILDGLLDALFQFLNWVGTWWLKIDHIDLTETNTVANLQAWLAPIVAIIAVGGILWQSLQMIITRKPNPLVFVFRGIWNTVLWGAVAIIGVNLALTGVDGYAEWVLEQAMGEFSTDRWNEEWSDAGLGGTATDTGAAVLGVLGAILAILVALIAAVIQSILMLFRDVGIIILTGMLQLAASGTFTQTTSTWFKKVFGWLLALVLYKGMVATIYAIGFSLLADNGGSAAEDLWKLLMGLMTIIMSLVALPVMLKFFGWVSGSLSEGGGFAALAAGVGSGAMAHSMMTSNNSANSHAQFMDQQAGNASGQGQGGGDDPPPPPPPPTGGGDNPGQSGTDQGGGNDGQPPTFNPAPEGPGSATVAAGGAEGAAAGASAGEAAGAGAGATGAAAAGGPVGIIIAAGVQGAQMVRGAADNATNPPGEG